jgi:two-component system, NtrC family, nitrogen regulation sensor histidine kinase NtrY
MAFRHSFALGLVLRLLLIMLLSAAAVALVWLPGYHAATLLLFLASIGAIFGLVGFVGRANRDMARFVDAVTSGDFAQSFSPRHSEAHFAELAQSLQSAMERQRAQDLNLRQQALRLAALVDDAPIALAEMDGDQLFLLNKAARRLLGGTPSFRLAAYDIFGTIFVRDLVALQPGERRLSEIVQQGSRSRVMLSAAALQAGGRHSRIISLLPIQSELDAAEMSLARDLVRVLTHEIMNSLTPVTSLAKTAAQLMETVGAGGPEIDDARAAVETVARRSESLMHFVRSYRALTVLPAVRLQKLNVSALLAELARLFRAQWPAVILELGDGDVADIEADPDLLSQLLINLLRNAAEAASSQSGNAHVSLSVRRRAPDAIIIDVTDNGPGITPEQRADIFLPFFTTKTLGTGVGLSLSRQIAVAHGGSLSLVEAEPGRTCFRLMLK